MKLILNQSEINSAFGCRLEELGLANINKASIEVSFKSTRGTDGSTEAEVEFEFHEPVNTSRATQPAANETKDVQDEQETESETAEPGLAADDVDGPANDDESKSDIFG